MTHQLVDIGGLLTRPPFSTLFTINPTTRDAIIADMREKDFDPSKPIDIWREGFVVVDGHTRLEAARELGIEDIPIYVHDFDDELAALEYAIHNQRNRRNLTSVELLRIIPILDAAVIEHRGGNRNPYGFNQYVPVVKSTIVDLTNEKRPKSHVITAEKLGINPKVVERVRLITSDPIAVADVEAGMSISGAANRAAERRREEKQGRTNGDYPLPGAHTDWSTVARPTIDETTPTFRAREHGGMCLSNAERLEMVVAERLALASDQGIDLDEIVANDRDVRKVWREAAQAALRAYKAIRAIAGEVS